MWQFTYVYAWPGSCGWPHTTSSKARARRHRARPGAARSALESVQPATRPARGRAPPMYCADRAQHVAHVILPVLAEGPDRAATASPFDHRLPGLRPGPRPRAGGDPRRAGTWRAGAIPHYPPRLSGGRWTRPRPSSHRRGRPLRAGTGHRFPRGGARRLFGPGSRRAGTLSRDRQQPAGRPGGARRRGRGAHGPGRRTGPRFVDVVGHDAVGRPPRARRGGRPAGGGVSRHGTGRRRQATVAGAFTARLLCTSPPDGRRLRRLRAVRPARRGDAPDVRSSSATRSGATSAPSRRAR